MMTIILTWTTVSTKYHVNVSAVVTEVWDLKVISDHCCLPVSWLNRTRSGRMSRKSRLRIGVWVNVFIIATSVSFQV